MQQRDGGEIGILGAGFRHQLEGHVGCAGQGQHQRGPLAAAALDLPRAAAVGSGEDRAEVADGETGRFVDKGYGAERRVLTGGLRLPGLPAIGRVEDARARRAGDPNLSTLRGDGLEIEIRADVLRQLAGRRLPTVAQVVCRHHQAAVADQPAAGRRGQPQRAEGAGARNGRGGKDDAAAHERGEAACCAGDRAGFGIEKVGGQPSALGVGGQGPPGLAAVARREHA